MMYICHLVIGVCVMMIFLNLSNHEESNHVKGRVESVSVPKTNLGKIFRGRARFRSGISRSRTFRSRSRYGGGTGSGSGSGSRWNTNRGYRSYRGYRNVVPQGRIIYGSSPYTSSNWGRYAMLGYIYGGMFYRQNRWGHHHHHPSRGNPDKPTICTNNYKLRPNSDKAYGHFICPLFNMSDSCEFCCGEKTREYCCNYTDAQEYYGKTNEDKDETKSTIILVVIILVIFLLLVVPCIVMHSRRERRYSYRPMYYPGQSYPTPMQPEPVIIQVQPQPAPFQSQSMPIQSQPSVVRQRRTTSTSS